MPKCRTCQQDKPENLFYESVDSRGRKYRRKDCLDCRSIHANSRGNARYKLLVYGMDSIQLKQFYTKHENKCGICGSTIKLVIDHNHETGQLRGLLCSSCNLCLGKFHDSIDHLEKAIAYLRKYEKLPVDLLNMLDVTFHSK